MRDPDGRLSFCEHKAIRHLHDPDGPSARFLRNSSASEMVEAGLLLPFQFDGADQIQSPRLPFVSYPHEWCDAQLLAAATLTLEVSRRALIAGHELKDASAWNVLFDGRNAIFCDHLSFQPIARRQWWAFGQFARHFLLPLGISRQRGMHGFRLFATYRDGIPVDQARRMLGMGRYLTRLWPLMVASRTESPEELTPTGAQAGPPLHENLYKFSEALLPKRRRTSASQWSGYVDNRQHYSERSGQAKLQRVGQWVDRLTPRSTIDLGCNTGEFAHLAARAGAAVIAIDLDHDCVQDIFEHLDSASRIHALIADLGDLSAGRGWAGTEFPGLVQRLEGQADLLLMLALVHHLMVSEGIPIDQIADLAARLTTRYAVVELIDPADPMMARLSLQRAKDVTAVSRAVQQASFEVHFEVMESLELPDIPRTLLLLRRRA